MTRRVSYIGKGSIAGGALAASLLLAGWAVAHNTGWIVPPEAKKLKNPVAATAQNLDSSHAIWMDKCANCHGEKGGGDGPEAYMYNPEPAALNSAHMMGEMTDGEIYWKMTEGRKPMPSFKKQLSDEQRWAMVNYLRTLVVKPAAKPAVKPAVKPATKPAGH